MSCFNATLVSWVLCAVMSQAAPMAVSNHSQEGQTTSASAPAATPSSPQSSPGRTLPSHEKEHISSESDKDPEAIPNLARGSPIRSPSSQRVQPSSSESESEPEEIPNPSRTSQARIPPTSREQILSPPSGAAENISKPSPHPPPNQPQTITTSAPVNVHLNVPHPPTIKVEPSQCKCSCPPNSQPVPCPDDQKSPENPESSAEKIEPKKKTGLWNGFTKVVKLVCNTVYEGLVGENGYLTNLPDKIVFSTPAPPKKVKIQKEESQTRKSEGRVTACCIFNRGGPPVKGDESDNETSTTNAQNGQAPAAAPINFVYVRNRQTGTPGAPAPAQAPLVPGAKSKTRNFVFNGCCIGKRLFNFKKIFTWIFKPQINICSCVANVNGAEVTA